MTIKLSTLVSVWLGLVIWDVSVGLLGLFPQYGLPERLDRDFHVAFFILLAVVWTRHSRKCGGAA